MNTLDLSAYAQSIEASLSIKQAKPTLTIEHTPVSFKQILRWMRSMGRLPEFLQDILSQFIIEQELQKQTDLDIDAVTVQEAIKQFRQQNDLQDAQRFQGWLLQKGWDEAIFYEQIQFNLKLNQFKAQLAAPRLLKTFIEQKLVLDQVALSRIVVHSQDLAEELKFQIAEDGASFEQLAQDYSQTDDALTNGMMGIVSRAEAQCWSGIDPYQVQVGAVIGPIALEQGWCLLRVEKRLPAELTDSVKDFLQEQIFQQWLAERLQAIAVDLNFSDD